MGDIISTGRGGSGPTNITPPKPGTGNGALVAQLLGARFGGGSLGGGFGFNRLGRSRRKPGLDPTVDPTLDELGGGVGPNGEIYDPENTFGVRDRPANRAGLDQLRGYSSALGAWRGRPGSSGGTFQGAGFGQPDDMIKKLLMARMGGGGL